MRIYPGSGLLLFTLSAAFVLEVAMGVVANDDGLIALGALPDTGKLNGEYWRWISFGFIHWDLTHLLLNTILLLLAGPIAERRTGSIWLLIVFCITSIASGIGISIKHLLWPSQGASVGASGGMFGLLGLALVLIYRFPPSRSTAKIVLFIAISCGFLYSMRPGISLTGHVIGFSVGMLAALLIKGNGRVRLTEL